MGVPLCGSGDDLEGVIELPGPPESPPPSTQVEGAVSEESAQTTPTPLEGKEASAEQSVEGPEAKARPSMAKSSPGDSMTRIARSALTNQNWPTSFFLR